jgi:Asparagine synthase
LGRGYFRREYVEKMLERHVDGREDNSPRIWALLVAELWHREYIDRSVAAAPLTTAP